MRKAMQQDISDTIAAVATSSGSAGIGIIRLSGAAALEVAGRIFIAKDKAAARDYKAYSMHYGWIASPQDRLRAAKPAVIDEVILTVMRAPRSYTKEDVVEINCHGGIVSLRKILDLVLAQGARLAQPGEFTKRAFLNGRIDLAQAEAVLDIIQAKSDAALQASVSQLKGHLSAEIDAVREQLLGVLAGMEAAIDFPEEELAPDTPKEASAGLAEANRRMCALLETSCYGQILREGIHVVICGRPNVGKSSLLNALLKQERSIVTPIAGTTRDTIEEIVDIKGIPVRIVDTAGILEPRDLIEKKAVQRSKAHIEAADLVILVFDASKQLCKDDQMLIRRLHKKTVIAVINKIDLAQKIELGKVVKNFVQVVGVSAKKLQGLELLEQAIVHLVHSGKVNAADSKLLTNARHIGLVRNAQKLIAEAVNSVDNKLSIELVAQDIKDALELLDELLGKKFSEDLLDKIFSEFCIGK